MKKYKVEIKNGKLVVKRQKPLLKKTFKIIQKLGKAASAAINS